VHACIGPPGHRESRPRRKDRIERRTDCRVHGPEPRLRRPAGELPEVVLEREIQQHRENGSLRPRPSRSRRSHDLHDPSDCR
jgi:hypothetical protein